MAQPSYKYVLGHAGKKRKNVLAAGLPLFQLRM